MTLVGPTAGWATAASVLACAGALALLLALQFPYAFHRVFDAVFVRFTGKACPHASNAPRSTEGSRGSWARVSRWRGDLAARRAARGRGH